MSQIRYLSGKFECDERPLWWHKQGLQQTASGYGNKLATAWMLRREGEKVWRRVYAVCWSNAASHYVLIKGEPHWLSGDFRQGVA
jgi:hypothetical protein